MAVNDAHPYHPHGEPGNDCPCNRSGFDTLIRLRQPYQSSLKESEEVTARLLCVFVPDKPKEYRRAMQQFRLHFAKISLDPTVQAEFANSVRQAALVVTRPEDIVWRPSLYFQYIGRDREEWY